MANIIVIGAGVVGTATGLGFLHHDNDVQFVDVSSERLANLRKNGYSAVHPSRMNLTSSDAVFVSVTALTGDEGIDLTHLLQATKSLGQKLADVHAGYPVIVYRCTMPPGTVRTTLIPLLEAESGKRHEEDFGVVYNPEYLRAVSAEQDFLHPRVVTLSSLENGNRAFKTIHEIMTKFGAPIHWLPYEAAELQKYVNNVGNAVKISTYNWFRALGQQIQLPNETIDQACELSVKSAEGLWNPSYGTRNYGPYDGACLPKDTQALKHYAAARGMDTRLLDAVQEINTSVQKGITHDNA